MPKGTKNEDKVVADKKFSTVSLRVTSYTAEIFKKYCQNQDGTQSQIFTAIVEDLANGTAESTVQEIAQLKREIGTLNQDIRVKDRTIEDLMQKKLTEEEDLDDLRNEVGKLNAILATKDSTIQEFNTITEETARKHKKICQKIAIVLIGVAMFVGVMFPLVTYWLIVYGIIG
ncbi:MAG: hypothetical protein FWG68_10635 [Defluviitaleaceae bacterium]|nr:hypothetical protein [Defluviitaleaceae bacterium]